MKIVRAMKKIARLQGEVKDLKERLSDCLTTLAENDYHENFKELYDQTDKKIDEIISLKLKIMSTNIKNNMFEKILRMGELKGKIIFLKSLEPKEGLVESRFALRGDTASNYKSQITVAERNKMISQCQEDINKLTDELDDFNATTDI